MLDDGSKCFRIGNGQISENFAVHLDVGFTEQMNELAVANAMFADCCVKASDPQFAEITLLFAAVSK